MRKEDSMSGTRKSLQALSLYAAASLVVLVGSGIRDVRAQGSKLGAGSDAALAQHAHSSKAKHEPFVVAEQGSFFVGGVKVQVPGTLDPFTPTANASDDGQIYHYDRLYAQYQIPPAARQYPLVLIHGGGGTGKVWESTPDGREGYQTIFLRRGFAVYIVDFPRRGRAGFPSYNGPFGQVDGAAIVPNKTNRAGVQYAWSRWRLGPKYPDVFPVQQFPMKGLDQFMQHLVPTVSDDAAIISGAL